MTPQTQHILRMVAEYLHAKGEFEDAIAHSDLLEQRWNRGMQDMVKLLGDMTAADERQHSTGRRTMEMLNALEDLCK